MGEVVAPLGAISLNAKRARDIVDFIHEKDLGRLAAFLACYHPLMHIRLTSHYNFVAVFIEHIDDERYRDRRPIFFGHHLPKKTNHQKNVWVVGPLGEKLTGDTCQLELFTRPVCFAYGVDGSLWIASRSPELTAAALELQARLEARRANMQQRYQQPELFPV